LSMMSMMLRFVSSSSAVIYSAGTLLEVVTVAIGFLAKRRINLYELR
jgi:hypothetical protein